MTTVCLRLLERREHSPEELRLKLKVRGYQSSDIGLVITRLESQGLLNSRRFAEQYSQSRMNRGFGPLTIQRELRERGIARIHIDCVVDEESQDWDKVVSEVYRKKYSAVEPCAELEYSKRARYLAQRGFTMDQIRRFLSDLESSDPN